MKKYILRSVKYFIALCVIYTALMWLMSATGSTPLTLRDDLQILLHTRNGYMMIGAMVVLSALYPMIGFMRRKVDGDMHASEELIIRAMDMSGFALKSRTDEELVFGARGLKRLWLLFEDDIHVTQQGSQIELRGIRRQVVRIAIRLEGYIYSRRND